MVISEVPAWNTEVSWEECRVTFRLWQNCAQSVAELETGGGYLVTPKTSEYRIVIPGSPPRFHNVCTLTLLHDTLFFDNGLVLPLLKLQDSRESHPELCVLYTYVFLFPTQRNCERLSQNKQASSDPLKPRSAMILKRKDFQVANRDGYLADFWGPVSNFGIPIAAVMDTQKSPDLYVLSRAYISPSCFLCFE